VKFSGRPADREHQYGHGKIENLSALFETILLLATCVWIIYEAIQRLFYKTVEIEVSVWAFIVMATSIVIDYSRSRVLYRAARKHNSQALEADALHFSTDIWSSSVVILGLIFVLVGEAIPALSFLKQADAIAAIAVAGIVVYVSIELGIRTIQGLLDFAPKGMAEKITAAVEGVPGVINCHNVRVRVSGPSYFVDVHAVMDPSLSIVEAHELTEKIEAAVQAAVPHIDVTVHPEPAEEQNLAPTE
jgi:cation diffusion facilitator family transporter